MGAGAFSMIRSASSMAGPVERWENRVIDGQFRHLRRRGLDEALLREPQRGVPEACQALDVFLAVVVVDVDAVAALDDLRARILMHRGGWYRGA